MSIPKHILVIRLSALGDIAMIVPVLRILEKTYPEVRVSVVSKKYAKALFKELPEVHLLEADVKGVHKGLGLLKLASEAKGLGIDAVADLHNVIRSKIIRNYLSLAGLRTAVIDKGRAEKKLLTSGEEAWFKPLKSTHERYAEVFAQLGVPIDLSSHEFPKPKKVTPRLLNILGTAPKKAIGIAPFAAYGSKMYPMEMMTQVIAALDRTNAYKILLFGGGSEEITKLSSLETEFVNATNVAGQLPFEEELALISNLDLMVSMDSSNGHLAAMYGVPVITLWGVTHPYAGFKPFLQPDSNQMLSDKKQYPLIPTSVYGNKYPESYESVMSSIAVESVIQKIRSLL